MEVTCCGASQVPDLDLDADLGEALGKVPGGCECAVVDGIGQDRDPHLANLR